MKLTEKELLIIRSGLLELIQADNSQDTNAEEALLEKITDEIWNVRRKNAAKVVA